MGVRGRLRECACGGVDRRRRERVKRLLETVNVIANATQGIDKGSLVDTRDPHVEDELLGQLRNAPIFWEGLEHSLIESHTRHGTHLFNRVKPPFKHANSRVVVLQENPPNLVHSPTTV